MIFLILLFIFLDAHSASNSASDHDSDWRLRFLIMTINTILPDDEDADIDSQSASDRGQYVIESFRRMSISTAVERIMRKVENAIFADAEDGYSALQRASGDESEPTDLLLKAQKKSLINAYFLSRDLDYSCLSFSQIYNLIKKVTDSIEKLLITKHHALTSQQILDLTATKICARRFFILDSLTFNAEGSVIYPLDLETKRVMSDDAMEFWKNKSLTSEKTLYIDVSLEPLNLQNFLRHIDTSKLDLESFFYILSEFKKVAISRASIEVREWNQRWGIILCSQLLSSLQGFCSNNASYGQALRAFREQLSFLILI
ncbi:MAG: hypothetical protein OXC30_01375 [Alphaproteobacteria bacterium]|nr:hypothetical protein [Alphaproteobacteria bacterium]